MKKQSLFLLSMIIPLFMFAGPKLEFRQKTIDFGKLEMGKFSDIEFEFENKGDELLVIDNVKASCGCTAAKLDKKEYKPGEKGAISVRFYSRGYNGRVTKSISVFSNDKSDNFKQLLLTGEVFLKDFSKAELDVAELSFGEVVLGKSYTKSFKITNTGNQPLRIIELTTVPELTVDFDKKIVEPKETLKVNVTFKLMEKRNFLSWIRLQTDSHDRRTVLKVEAKVKGLKPTDIGGSDSPGDVPVEIQ